MKQFMAVFLASATKEPLAKWQALDPKEKKEREDAGKKAWHEWVEKHKKSVIVMGSPLGKTKKIDKKGIADIKNLMTAYTVVTAESHSAAAEMFVNHPHFTIFPGDSIEIMECLPIPGM